MAEPAAPKTAEDELLRMTAEGVSAYVSNNTLATAQLGDVIQAVYNSLRGLEGQVAEPTAVRRASEFIDDRFWQKCLTIGARTGDRDSDPLGGGRR